MGSSGYRPKLSVEITDEQYRELSKIIPWGLQKHLFSAIINDIIDLAKTGQGTRIVEAIVSGLIKPSEILPTLKGDIDGDDR